MTRQAILIPSARNFAPCSFLLIAVAWCSTAHAEPAPPQARVHFRAGVAHLQSQDADRYAHAYREFKAAYAAFPNWKILGNLGVAAQGLERYGEAIDAYQEYLGKGAAEVKPREVEAVRRDLERLRAEHAKVTLEAPRGPFWIVDTRIEATGPIVNQYGPFDSRAELQVKAGEHEFRLDDAADTSPAWKVQLLPGDASAHIFEMKSAPAVPAIEAGDSTEHEDTARESDSGTSYLPSYILWASGAAAAATGTVLYLRGRELQQNADRNFARDCPNGVVDSDPRCTRTTAGDAKAANWKTAGVLTGIGAAGALVAGAALYFWGGGSTDSSESSEQAEGVVLRGYVAIGSLGLSGTF